MIKGLPIGDKIVNRRPVIQHSQIVQTTHNVIAAGMIHPRRFVLQGDGLAANSGNGSPFDDVEARCGSVATGFQTKDPGNEGPLTVAAMQAAVNAGVYFVEVYQSVITDVLANPSDPQYQALTYGADNLPANQGCAPLTLTASPHTAVVSTAVSLTATPESGLMNAANFTDSGYNPPYPTWTFTADINVFEGRTLLFECTVSDSTCSMNEPSPGVGKTIYEADIGAPGTRPFTSQALVSARSEVERSGSVG